MSERGRRHFGSVRKLPSGRWQASYWHEGIRHAAPTTFLAKADALAYLATVEADIVRGSWVDRAAGKELFCQLARRWLESNPAKRYSSMKRDEAIVRLHLVPVLGANEIASIGRAHVQQLVNEWAGSCAPRTTRRQYDVLRAIFAFAVANDELLRTPCRQIKLPVPGKGRGRALSADDVWRLATAMPRAYAPMVWLGAVLGLRWGEVAGLQRRSISFERSAVLVGVQLDRQGLIAPPKSDAGIRVLGTPDVLLDMLREHLADPNVGMSETSLLFTSADGSPLDYSNWRHRVWLPAIAEADLVGVGFHDLRRTAATALVAEGVDIKTAQTRLGHSDPRLTLSLYAQATAAGDRAATNKLGERFFGNRTEEPAWSPSPSPSPAPS